MPPPMDGFRKRTTSRSTSYVTPTIPTISKVGILGPDYTTTQPLPVAYNAAVTAGPIVEPTDNVYREVTLPINLYTSTRYRPFQGGTPPAPRTTPRVETGDVGINISSNYVTMVS